MKIICAGLPKTGTKTMAEALRILGYNVHDVFQQFFYDKDLWDKVLNNTATVEDYQKTLQDVDVVTDFPGCVLWEQILEAFPEAKVILMVRSSEDEWYNSVRYHYNHMSQINHNVLMYPILNLIFGPVHSDFMRHVSSFIPACLGTIYTWGQQTEALVRTRYRQHNMYVKDVCPRKNLLVFNVKEGWGPLCKFLGVEAPDRPFPIKNVKTEVVDQVARGEYEHDCGYRNIVFQQALTRILILVAVLVAFFSFMFLQ